MKKLTLVLFSLLSLVALGAHPATNGWEQMKLQGRVKSVTITTGEDECEYNETFTFGEDGKFGHIFIFDLDYVFADGDFTYEYDESGQISSLTRPSNEDNSIENFLYDAQGCLFLSTKNSEGAGILFTERTFWDLQGKKTLATMHEWNDLVWVESYSYNDMGQIIQSLRPASPYSRQGYSTHEYDERGNRLLSIEWESPTDAYIQTRFEYSYDDLGNILRSLKFIDYDDGAGEILEEIARYKYTYFED